MDLGEPGIEAFPVLLMKIAQRWGAPKGDRAANTRGAVAQHNKSHLVTIGKRVGPKLGLSIVRSLGTDRMSPAEMLEIEARNVTRTPQVRGEWRAGASIS